MSSCLLVQKSRFLELLAHFVGLMSFFFRVSRTTFIPDQSEDPQQLEDSGWGVGEHISACDFFMKFHAYKPQSYRCFFNGDLNGPRHTRSGTRCIRRTTTCRLFKSGILEQRDVQCTPQKINVEPKKWRFGRWFSFSIRWFLGSMLIFQGVVDCILMPFLSPHFHIWKCNPGAVEQWEDKTWRSKLHTCNSSE